ncbi:MAG: acetylxylan esterase [Chloroflexi bacterium]|nr:acetylxylan esterase [Chloroflexota bacterium]
MLYFVSVKLALGYLLFSFLSALGILQLVATRYRLRGLAFLDHAQHGAKGYALAALLIVCGALLFFAGQWHAILTPGPAGSELAFLFGLSATGALAVTCIVTSIVQKRRPGFLTQAITDQGETVTVGRGTGRLYLPHNLNAPAPAVVLVPGLNNNEGDLTILAHQMAEEGFAALVICLDRGSCLYPEVLTIVPAAISMLSKRPEIDEQRLGIVGHGLGGDLAIRAASTDKQIKAVAALAPVLVEVQPSLDLLREMPYLEALRWARDRSRANLRAALNALEYGSRIAPRSFLLLYGAEDRLVSRTPTEAWQAQQATSMRLEVIEGVGHFDLVKHPVAVRVLIQWLREHL